MLDSFAWCFLDQLSDQSFQQYSRNLLLLKLFCDIAPSSCAVRLCVCVSVDQVVCVGSMAELEELTGVKVTDLHRERWVTDQTRRSSATWTCTQGYVSVVIVWFPHIHTGCVCVCVSTCTWVLMLVYECVLPLFHVTCLLVPEGCCGTQITLLFRSSSANYL